VGWLLLAALVILWAAFLIPSWRGSSGTMTDKTMKDFERNMNMLAETESQGRWIVTPRKGTTFVGRRARAQARARERRRRVLVVLIESLALTALIGLVPPLRAMWYATAILLVLLGGYVWALVAMRTRTAEARGTARADEAAAAPATASSSGRMVCALSRKMSPSVRTSAVRNTIVPGTSNSRLAPSSSENTIAS